mgnify:CR=1 FL=1
MSGLRWRYIVIFLALVLTLAYSLPNVAGPSLQKFLPNSKVNLGLDLRGGIHLTLGVDVDKAVTNSLALTGQGSQDRGAAAPCGGRCLPGIHPAPCR